MWSQRCATAGFTFKPDICTEQGVSGEGERISNRKCTFSNHQLLLLFRAQPGLMDARDEQPRRRRGRIKRREREREREPIKAACQIKFWEEWAMCVCVCVQGGGVTSETPQCINKNYKL